MGGVDGEWVGGFDQGVEVWCYVCNNCLQIRHSMLLE